MSNSYSIKMYIKHILSKMLSDIQMKNNPFETSIGSGDIENIFEKIYDELEGYPENYLEEIFYPILKHE